jgi:hypothetical protein
MFLVIPGQTASSICPHQIRARLCTDNQTGADYFRKALKNSHLALAWILLNIPNYIP